MFEINHGSMGKVWFNSEKYFFFNEPENSTYIYEEYPNH